jgi:putative DNA primase/helicase
VTDLDAVLGEMDAAAAAGANDGDPLEASGLTALAVGCDLGDVAVCLRHLAAGLNRADPLGRRVVRNRAVAVLKDRKVQDAAGLVDAAFGSTGTDQAGQGLAGSVLALRDVEPWPEPVNGAELLADIAAWFRRYLYIAPEAADAGASWVVLTHLLDDVFYAPLLAILSATRRCGKSLLLDLLRLVVRRGYLTSGSGVTPAVLFRLNERDHPTLLVDEGEKLAGRDADRDIIAMLNVGYRRGAKVLRCVERNGDFDIRDFDAFGFRAVAAIGSLWDTLLDRAIVLRLERKPQTARVARFNDAQVTAEGAELARRVRRWVTDHQPEMAVAYASAQRPDWLDSRACDNWLGLFAVAAVVGGEWPTHMEAAARVLQVAPEDEQDHAERLVHDLQVVFAAAGWPAVLKSGDLVRELNAIETAPWGDYRHGDGITAHRVAHLLRPFGVRPAFRRDEHGPVRGWWQEDLQPVFDRYPLTSSLQNATTATSVTEDESQEVTVVAVVAVPAEGPVGGDGFKVHPTMGGGQWHVHGPGDQHHHVDRRKRNKSGLTCNCPKRGDCEHIAAVQRYRAENETPEQAERRALQEGA